MAQRTTPPPTGMGEQPSWKGLGDAPGIAATLLGTGSVRFRHMVGVATAATHARTAVPPADVSILVAAAWLHDVGYATELATTKFHPLDGARYLRTLGAPQRLCCLVAHHTGALVEASERGIADTLITEFPPEHSPTADALTYADLTTGPDGAPVSAEERIAEILRRYPTEHVVHRAISTSAPTLQRAVARVERRLSGHQEHGSAPTAWESGNRAH